MSANGSKLFHLLEYLNSSFNQVKTVKTVSV
jgi:hypothetical protein